MRLARNVLVATLLLLGPLANAGDKRTPAEKQLDDERKAANGILVGQPKVYDDSILQQMLSAAEARLASLQVLDQTGIASRLGALTGATQTINSFALSVQGPPIPQVVTTANGATNTSVAGSQNSSTQGTAPSGPTSSTTSQTSTQNTTNAPVTNVVTTNPQITPPPVTAPAPTTSLPSAFSVSASDILNEQMQLTYEIANLRLLLEGSLNDRLISDPDKGLHMVKPRVTLGFPITLKPDARHKDAIAVVEVVIEKVQCPQPTVQKQGQQGDQQSQQQSGQTGQASEQSAQQQSGEQPAQQAEDEEAKSEEQIKKEAAEKNAKKNGKPACDDLEINDPPAIVALLPRDKTYNVASLTDSSISIGAGVVTQVVGISGSFLHGRKTYYYVQDQDTVALTFEPPQKNTVGFLWEFRPVLGARLLREGLKQTFVQLSFPSNWSAPSFGTVHIRTYWRDYDARKNLVKRIRPNSLVELNPPYPIPNYSMEQKPSAFDKASLEDLGNGQMLVNLDGRFLGGTYVRVGTTILGDGTAGFSSEYKRIRFVAPIADLASKNVVLVARDGTTWPIQLNNVNCKLRNRELAIKGYTLKTLDDSNTQLSLTMAVVTNNPSPQPPTETPGILPLHKDLPLVFLIGGKVFGYSDAPLRRDKEDVLTAVVPTSLLATNPLVSVRSLFTTDRYWRNAQIPIKEFAGGGVVPKIAALEAKTDSARYLIYGVKFGDKPQVLSPAGGKLLPFGQPAIPDMMTINLTKDQVKSQKQVVIAREDGFVYQIAVPSVELPDATKSTIKPVQPITVGSNEVAFKGADFSTLQKVMFNDVELPLRKQTDGKVIWLSGLKPAGVTAAVKKQTLDFYFKAGKQSVSIDVVAGP
jgi:hypothetical protein